jgi:hypothetical protein
LLATWFLGFWALMTVISLGRLPSGRWILNTTNIRYWYPIFPPLVLGGVGGLYLLVRNLSVSRLSTYAVPAVVAVGMLTMMPAVAEYQRCEESEAWRAPPRDRWVEFRDWLSRPEAQRFENLWVNQSAEQAALIYVRSPFGARVWSGEVKLIGSPDHIEELDSSDDIVLVDQPLIAAAGSTFNGDEWVPLFASSDKKLVVVVPASEASGSGIDAGEWWTSQVDTAELAEDFAKCGGNPYERLP